ncbi:MAG: hypothetical protein HY040_03105 [Planctomycetes bacterium]|nr:hypothetical protein [Planctomycetota bacterium]
MFLHPNHSVGLVPQWRTVDSIELARTIYNDQRFSLLPVLANALLDAGCNDEAILAHCRRDSDHTRGCWVVDLVLDQS